MFLADMPRVVAHGPDDGFLAFDLCVWSEEQMVPGLSHIWSAAHTGSRSLGVKRVSGGKQGSRRSKTPSPFQQLYHPPACS